MYEAIKDFNKIANNLLYVVANITPINNQDDIKRIENHLQSEHKNLRLEWEEWNFSDLESTLECIYGYKVDLSKMYILKLERLFTDIIYLMAETHNPTTSEKTHSLINANSEVKEFISSVETGIAYYIETIVSFCADFLNCSIPENTYSNFIKYVGLLSDKPKEEFRISFLVKEQRPVVKKPLSNEESQFLLKLNNYAIERNLFSTSVENLEHIAWQKISSKNTPKIKFSKNAIKTDGYRLGKLLGLTLKQMNNSFDFYDGEITKNHRPKMEYSSDFSSKIEELKKQHFTNSTPNFLNFS